MRQKFPALRLPRLDYPKLVMKVTEVAAIRDDSDRLIQLGKAKIYQIHFFIWDKLK